MRENKLLREINTKVTTAPKTNEPKAPDTNSTFLSLQNIILLN